MKRHVAKDNARGERKDQRCVINRQMKQQREAVSSYYCGCGCDAHGWRTTKRGVGHWNVVVMGGGGRVMTPWSVAQKRTQRR
jgi:hypothetical protein